MIEVAKKFRELEITLAEAIIENPLKTGNLAFQLRNIMVHPNFIEHNKAGIYTSLAEVGYTDEQLQKLEIFKDYKP